MAKYKYTMKIDVKKILTLIEDAIGRRPDGHSQSGLHTFGFIFEGTDITPSQRQDALAALPEWIRYMYSFNREVLPDDEV